LNASVEMEIEWDYEGYEVVPDVYWEALTYTVKPGKPHYRLWIGEFPPCQSA